MLPQFFEMFDLTPRGLTFERIFWALVFIGGVVICLREGLSRRSLGDAWYGWALGLTMVGFGGYRLSLALFSGRLYFGQSGLKLSNYGLAIALGFITGIVVAVWQARRSPNPPTAWHILDLSFWILVFSILGSRIVFAIVNWRNYYNLCFSPELVEETNSSRDCLALLKFWKGGLVFYGGVFGAVFAGWIYCRRQRLSFMRTADVMIPSLALGHVFGRIGCLAAGCCFGRPCSVPWGIRMPRGSPAFEAQVRAFVETNPQAASRLLEQGHSLPVHPTQLYEATGELLLFFLLIFLRPKKRFHGQLLATWLILYSILRGVVEFYRGDKVRGFLVEWAVQPLNRLLGMADAEPTFLSTSQAISLVTVAVGIGLYGYLSRRIRRGPLLDSP